MAAILYENWLPIFLQHFREGLMTLSISLPLLLHKELQTQVNWSSRNNETEQIK
jgi:hypothetical protein